MTEIGKETWRRAHLFVGLDLMARSQLSTISLLLSWTFCSPPGLLSSSGQRRSMKLRLHSRKPTTSMGSSTWKQPTRSCQRSQQRNLTPAQSLGCLCFRTAQLWPEPFWDAEHENDQSPSAFDWDDAYEKTSVKRVSQIVWPTGVSCQQEATTQLFSSSERTT